MAKNRTGTERAADNQTEVEGIDNTLRKPDENFPSQATDYIPGHNARLATQRQSGTGTARLRRKQQWQPEERTQKSARYGELLLGL